MNDQPGTDPGGERRSPLHDIHVDAGASFTDFAGWQMPVRYSSDLAEHHAVRTAAGMFDISHMAEIEVRGPHAAEYLDFALAGKLSSIAQGQAKYSLLLDAGGGVVDDVIVYRLSDDRFMVVANAGNREAAFSALTTRADGFQVDVDDLSDLISLIAVQGPNSHAILDATAGLDLPGFADLKYYWFLAGTFEGETVHVARTGYTGEDGYELYIHRGRAADLWRALITAGEQHGLVPAGLASRDTLRLEAGMPLYGHELGLDILPVQAGLGRVVALGKETDFVGRPAVEAGPPEGARVLVGLVSEGKRAGRAGYALLDGDAAVGEITSGALSPTLGHPIAMAFVDPQFAEPGTTLDIDVRGSRIPATVVALPFYRRSEPSREK
ncbi:MAG: glycine cleavage system aminomethyltransferase GcvT [Actinomycetota bacterium]|nr:glycine cleavage system aminomethyltransferase GcvT [Actinomycetota bacterium]